MMKNFASIDGVIPQNMPLSAKYRRSVPYAITKDRMPIILTKIIDNLCRDKIDLAEKYGMECGDELKDIIGSLSKLKSEVQTNKPLTPLSPATKDADMWNFLLNLEKEKMCGKDPTWFECTFLFSDCYFFRRIAELFELSKALSSYDPYLKQKDDALMNSIESLSALSVYSNVTNQKITVLEKDCLKEEAVRIFQISLWGNQCDLAQATECSGEKLGDALKQVVDKQECLLVNDLELAWEFLYSVRRNEYGNNMVIIDIVLDNAGYELASDFFLADFLSCTGLVDTVRMHVKVMPWFVSDAVNEDIIRMLNVLELASSEDTSKMVARWKNHLSSGKWKIEEDERFWTLPLPFNSMPKEDPGLYKKLEESSLIITKGDLNYRKLMGDINWAHSTEFSEALGTFNPAPILALRAVKTEVLVGVTPECIAKCTHEDPDWMMKGNYAVAQFHVPCDYKFLVHFQ